MIEKGRILQERSAFVTLLIEENCGWGQAEETYCFSVNDQP